MLLSVPFTLHLFKNDFKLMIMKRQRDESTVVTRTLLLRKHNFISASKIKNWFLKDTLLDWLDLYGEQQGYKKDNIPEPLDFTKFICGQGVKFESCIVGLLKEKLEKLKIKFAVVATDDRLDSRSVDKFNETKRLIEEGCPVIFHPVLRSEKLKLLGVADIIMQNWVIARLFNQNVNGDDFSGNSYNKFSVIDIKFSTIECDKNWNVIKTRQQAYYRGQVGFYSMLLSEMQNSKVSQGYLLGRKLKNSKETTSSAFDRLGMVDLAAELEEDIFKAVECYRKMVQSGESNRPRPNCCNTVDYPWHGAKMKIAKETNEPSMLWNVRETVDELSQAKRKIVNQILETQKGDTLIKIGNGKLELPKGEVVFVDFETVNDVWDTFDKLPVPNGTSMIFMIGLGVVENGRWKFYNWCVKSLTKEEEQRIVNEFVETLPKNSAVMHWTNAEPMWYNKVENVKPLKWFDLANLFQSVPITVKNALNFKLKNVAKAFYNQGLIDTCWSEENEVGGLGASSAAIYSQNQGSFENRWIKLTRDYNEIDTKVLYEIFELLKFLM